MKRIIPSLACLGLLAPVLQATSITYVGTESGTTVENWSNTAVVKTQDLNGDDRFGGAGYYQITPGAVGDPWSTAAVANNDLGITEEYPTQYSPPAFLSGGPVGVQGNYVNLDVSPFFKNPGGVDPVRQGSLWPDTVDQTEGNIPGDIPGIRSSVINITLGKSASFRLGVAVDTMADGYYAPDYVSVSNSSTGEIFSAQLVCDGVADMVFFDIGGIPGEEFEVSLWKIDDDLGLGTDSRGSIALITFDQLPTPTLTYTQNGSDITLSWELDIPGWILESSTDLGVGDHWDPVPGVVNNSVTLDMTGVPKNFFRLRKDP